jgi:hypothetical protein
MWTGSEMKMVMSDGYSKFDQLLRLVNIGCVFFTL